MSAPAAAIAAKPNADAAAAKEHIRGSSMLLGGRLISLGLNLAVNVLLVRSLAKGDYGAFSYALAVGSVGTTMAACGLHKTIARFAPIYHERSDYPRMLGAILLALAGVAGAGFALTLAVWGAHAAIRDQFDIDRLSASLLTILIVLAPIQAIDQVLEKSIAIFAKPRAIFYRKHVVGPALKLSAVLLLVLLHAEIQFLAAGYVAAALLGTLLYAGVLFAVLREQKIWPHLRLGSIKPPVRELFSFSVPLLSSELVFVLRGSMAIFLLEFFHSTTDVAEYRAVLPIARLNHVVCESFMLLFVPLASRMFARGEHSAVGEMYWSTATWIAVLSFPIFAATFALAQPATELLFGARYAHSGMILSVLAVGQYLNASLGFNAVTLKVFGKLRWIVAIDVISALVALALGLCLIDRFGALGAAVAVTLTYVVQNLLNQAALIRLAGVEAFPLRYLKAYASVALLALGLWVLQRVLVPPVAVGVVLALLASGVALWINRDALAVARNFPELRRIPMVGRLYGLEAK